jgi:hypothetical protein
VAVGIAIAHQIWAIGAKVVMGLAWARPRHDRRACGAKKKRKTIMGAFSTQLPGM